MRLRERCRHALDNSYLGKAVRLSTDKLRTGRRKAAADYGDFEGLRERGRQIRSHTIGHLDYYLEMLVERVRERGGHVFFARTADDANAYVLEVAKQRQAARVAKSKSMVSEELHLNRALEEAGIDVVETDLGEYIIQLAGEMPSHIVGPSIHKSRADVADLFAEIGMEPRATDTPTLTAFARRRLREVFLSADIGITGCNFAVAEEGAVTIVTNEGNGRMVTSLPPCQITVMGMERIVPTLDDLDTMLTLLTRSATGQKSSTYVNVMTGPKRPEETDGPEEFHLVILDNGRSEILGGDFQEVLNCIRCGACLNVCPVYRQIGGHAYGWVYPGPIGAVLTPLLRGIEEWGELAQASSLCGACDDACPVKIPLHDMLVEIRQIGVAQGSVRDPREAMAFKTWRWLMTRPQAYRWALRMARVLQRPWVRDGWLSRGVGPLAAWTDGRDFPAVADESFRERWRALEGESGQ